MCTTSLSEIEHRHVDAPTPPLTRRCLDKSPERKWENTLTHISLLHIEHCICLARIHVLFFREEYKRETSARLAKRNFHMDEQSLG